MKYPNIYTPLVPHTQVAYLYSGYDSSTPVILKSLGYVRHNWYHFCDDIQLAYLYYVTKVNTTNIINNVDILTREGFYLSKKF